jgi:eukaryotic-like serine/threonine-protein kinase
MDDNSFLKSYKKKTEGQIEERAQAIPGEPKAPSSLRYEERSGFVRSRRAESPGPARRGGSQLLAPILIGAFVIIAIAVGLLLYFNRGVEVIDFTGWAIADAQLWSSDKGVNLQIDQKYDDKIESGKIISQSPAKGAKEPKGGFVKLTVSKGHDLTVTLPLPDLMKMTMEEVQAWADANFMTKVRITTEFNDDVESGKVISYEINDNTVVDNVSRNTPIYVIVSKGKEDTSAVLITVPDFKQKTVAESYSFAQENGIVLEIVDQFDDYAPKGSVLSQSVKADEKMRKGDKITLTVSKGKKILVPDFSKDSKQKATAETAQLGISAAFVEKYSSQPAGEFISQSLAASSVYEDGDVLELDYSLGNSIVVANYVGQMRDAIDTWAKGLNDQGADITVSVSSTQSDSPKGTILYQSKANTTVGIQATIRITVSLGKVVSVPDFIAPSGSGYDVAITRDEAMALCKSLNIVPIFVASKRNGRLPGEVWYQSISAGREVYEGTTITLKYNPGDVQVKVPNFSGKTQKQIIATGYGKKFDITFVLADTYVDGFSGTVCKQSIRTGVMVISGTAITLTVSPSAEVSPEPTASAESSEQQPVPTPTP